MKRFGAVLLMLLVAGCAGNNDQPVVDKVLQDFGLQERPEGYVSGADRVFERLDEVGKAELRRLNTEGRHGEVLFEQGDNLQGRYYKQVKIYDNHYPLDARALSRTGAGERGYVGYIEYSYRVYESERKSNRTEAAAAVADIPTSDSGSDSYRYNFTQGGFWDGAKGERAR